MHILIQCALQEEARPLLSTLRLRRSGGAISTYDGLGRRHRLTLVISGPGWKNAVKTCDAVLAHIRPGLVISFGYAGALAADLSVADILLPSEVLIWNGPAAAPLSFKTAPFQSEAGAMPYHRGALLTSRKVVSSAARKIEIGKLSGGAAVDMEAGFVAQCAGKFGIPFSALKAVSDAAHEDIGMDFSPFIGPHGKIAGVRLLRYLAVHPAKISEVRRLYHASRRCSDSLIGAFDQLLQML